MTVKLTLRNLFTVVLITLIPALLASCGEAEFKVKGEVKEGADKTIILEKSDYHGRWVVVDSTRIKSSGSFSISAPAPISPEIYRLSFDDRYIYFPVDSVETIVVSASARDFGRNFKLSGSPQAEQMAEFDMSLQNLDVNDAQALSSFKRNVYSNYLKDARGGILSYYVLTKTVGGKMLYDPTNAEDAKYYAAVATSFDHYRPDDPHTSMLKQISMAALKKRNSASDRGSRVIQAPEITLIDIVLNDEDGNAVALSDIASQGKPTVLVFSLMNQPESPAFNRELAGVYKNGAVNIYHVSFDSGIPEWRQAAANLPWTTVIEPDMVSSKVLVDYNVQHLPTFFIYNRKGELVERASDFNELSKKLSGL